MTLFAKLRSTPLDGQGDPLATADAQRGDARLGTAPLQGVQQGHQHPRAAGPDGVAQGHRPPKTFIFSWGTARSFIAAMGTTENASLTSDRSTGPTSTPRGPQFLDRPDRGEREPLRFAGERRAAQNSGLGLDAQSLTFASDNTTTAAAPSLTLEALPAVTLPSFPNAGRSPEFLFVEAAGSSSWSTIVGPLRPGTSTGAISSAKIPSC